MILTKADVYEKTIKRERPACPHCGTQMKVWEVTEFGCSCGSGWGTPYLFVCFNDDCPPFVNGWESMRKEYGKRCSYRCICYPDSLVMEMMLVYSTIDGKTGIIDEETIAKDQLRGTDDDPEMLALIEHFEAGDLKSMLSVLFDNKAFYTVRQKAAELIGTLARSDAVEPMVNYRFADQRIRKSVVQAIEKINLKHGTRECPYCSEIIQANLTVCSECGKRFDAS